MFLWTNCSKFYKVILYLMIYPERFSQLTCFNNVLELSNNAEIFLFLRTFGTLPDLEN